MSEVPFPSNHAAPPRTPGRRPMTRQAITALLVSAAVMAWAGATLAQTTATDAKAEAPKKADAPKKAEAPKKVYHAGGRHDQKGHEAAVRAKEQGKKLEEPAVHPGGKHDERGHKAAINAEQKGAAK